MVVRHLRKEATMFRFIAFGLFLLTVYSSSGQSQYVGPGSGGDQSPRQSQYVGPGSGGDQ